MGVVNLTKPGYQVNTSKDGIVIVRSLDDIRGGKSLDVTGFEPKVIQAGHVIIMETATKNYKPMPASLPSIQGVATLGAIIAGSGYANGTYENVPLIGGSGKTVLATVVVSGGVVTAVTITRAGYSYKAGDILLIPAQYAGGTGSGSSVAVATAADSTGAYGALPSGHEYVGILKASIPTDEAFAGILTVGTVREEAMPYPLAPIKTAFKTARPLIDYAQ